MPWVIPLPGLRVVRPEEWACPVGLMDLGRNWRAEATRGGSMQVNASKGTLDSILPQEVMSSPLPKGFKQGKSRS